MTPLPDDRASLDVWMKHLDRRGAETDEQSESGEAGWWILPYFVIQKINSTTPSLIRLHQKCSLIRATPPVQEGSLYNIL